MSLKFVLAAIAAVGFAGTVHAQDVVIEGDAPIVEQVPSDEAVIVEDSPRRPRVYGWAMRPVDCGTFRYWNGVRCADARDEPPVP